MPKISQLPPAPILPLVGNEPFVVVQNGVTVKAPVDQIPINLSFPTIAALQAASPPAAEDSVYVKGYYASGDGGGHWRTRGTGAGEITDAAGDTWVVSGFELNDKMFGSFRDGVSDDLQSISNLFTFAEQKNANIYITGGPLTLSSSYQPLAFNAFIFSDPSVIYTGAGVINYVTYMIPFQSGPINSSFLSHKSYDSSYSAFGNVFQIASFAETVGNTKAVAVFGEGLSTSPASSAWGGNFVSYANNATSVSIGVEINFGVLASGGKSTGLVIAASGYYPTNAYIQTQPNNIASVPSSGINFNSRPGIPCATYGLIYSNANDVAIPYGVDFSATTFSTFEWSSKSFKVGPTPASVNSYIRIDGSSVGEPSVSAAGSVADVDLVYIPKGSGSNKINSGDGYTKIEANNVGISFYGAAPGAKPTITGSRGGNAALASLLTKLATLGLITDGTTA